MNKIISSDGVKLQLETEGSITTDLSNYIGTESSENSDEEKTILSFLVKDLKYVKACVETNVDGNWFTDNEMKAFYQRVIEFYKNHRSLYTKKYFIERVNAFFKIKNIQNPMISQYEEFYDSLLDNDFDDDDFKIKFEEWRRHVANRRILESFKQYHNTLKNGNDILSSHDSLMRSLANVKTYFDNDKIYHRASLAKDASMVLHDFINRKNNPDLFCGYTLGFNAIDERFSGIEKGKMTVIMGMSSSGKTTFARNISRHIQKKYDARICIISCEESRLDYMKKIVCAEIGLPLDIGNKGTINDEQLEHVAKKIEEMSIESDAGSCYEIIEVDARKYTIEELENIIETEYGTGYFDVVVLDHLSLVKSAQKHDKEYIEMGDVSKFFRDMAKRHNFAAILIAQAGRTSIKYNRNKREIHAYLENLEGSNKPGQDTDKALHVRVNEEDNSEAIITVVKDRDGERDYTIPLVFKGRYCHFANQSESISNFIGGDICGMANNYDPHQVTISDDGKLIDSRTGKEMNIPAIKVQDSLPLGNEDEISSPLSVGFGFSALKNI